MYYLSECVGSDACSDLRQTPKMEHLAKTVHGFKPLKVH